MRCPSFNKVRHSSCKVLASVTPSLLLHLASASLPRLIIMSSPPDSSKEKLETQHIDNVQPASHSETDQKPVGINTRLIWLNLWSMVAAMTYGLNAAIIASSLGQPNLMAFFNSPSPGIIGAVAALLNVGGIIGVPIIVEVSDRFGRKWAFFGSCCFSYLGAGLGAGAQTMGMLLAARLITGMGAWSNLMCAVTYQQEISPATRRGVLGGSVGVGISIGYVAAAWIGVGFFFVNSKINWRIPLILQIIPPIVTCIGLLVVPESPRWLASHGRGEESLHVLKKIHRSRLDPEYVIARGEYFQISEQVQLDKTLRSSWLSMFTVYKKRTWIAVLVMVSNQATGIQIMANFGPQLYAALGYSAQQSLLIAGGWITMTVAFQFGSALLTDRFGRRMPLILSVFGAGCVFMSMEAGLDATYGETAASNPAGSRAAVAALFLFVVAYSFGEPICYLYIGEIFPNHIRTKGIAVGLITVNLMTIWVTEGQPTAAAKIGYQYYLIFVVLSFVTAIMQWMWLPETANVPLEEMAQLFGDTDQVAVFAKDIFVNEQTHEILAAPRMV